MSETKTTEAGERTQHTPEDWRFLPETKFNRAEITTADARQVAQVFGDGKFERERRGRLIAAAPELLEALKIAAKFMLDVRYVIDRRDAYTPTLDKINTAIAKAEGRS
jgi:hypothetical protein